MILLNKKKVNMSYNNQKKSYILIPTIVGVAIALGFVLGFSIKWRGEARVNQQATISNLMKNLTHSGVKYSNIFSLIENSYVDSLAVDSIAETIIPTLLKKLDPHSSYIPATDVVNSQANLEGHFFGIGIIFNMLTDTITIQNVVPKGPSTKVGIEGGDRIIKINDSIVAGRRVPQDDILKMLRGEEGSIVKLGIERKGIDSLMNIDVKRGKVVINSIDAAYMVKPGIGYIKLLRFARSSHEEMNIAIFKLQEEGMKSLILDLTENRGGYLDQAIRIANEFLPKDNLIVSTQRRGVILQSEKADGKGNFIGLDVTILIDGNSASSSEIVAGALQDNDIGTIIGRRSFGKGLVQQQIPLNDGSLLNLTIARYHTPTGRCIQRPYTGDGDDYEMDYYNRAVHGELVNKDSIRLDSTLRYETPKGKIVYGGGGIMPDIFVPIDTLKYSDAERKLLISIVLASYTNKYIEKNREELSEIADFETLDAFFEKKSDDLYNNYIIYINDNGGKISKKDAKLSRKTVENVLKANVGRFTKVDDNAFYRYLLQEDDIILKAIEEINKKKE